MQVIKKTGENYVLCLSIIMELDGTLLVEFKKTKKYI